jgi:pimeloyl-ACP methyl ester carboxylesterase
MVRIVMRPLFLLSGLLCDETSWGDIPTRLADVAAVRIASFRGISTIASMAAEVLRNAPPSFALAGHSMGGRVALEVMRRAPERVSALALLNSGVEPAQAEEFRSRSVLVRLAQAQGMAALAQEWLPAQLGAPSARVASLFPALAAMVMRTSPAEFAAEVDALLNRPDAEPVLAGIKVPTLLVSAINDHWSSRARLAKMQRSVPHAVLIEVGAAGHLAPAEQPQAVARALRSWLARI